MKSPFSLIESRLNTLMLCDKHRLMRRIRGARSVKNSANQQATATALAAELEKAQQRVAARRAISPTIEYPIHLPVSQKQSVLLEAIGNHQVVIVAGETGSGKTTQLPKICLELGHGITGWIGHTQPRRLAARSVAERLADELGASLGCAVGYKVRFHEQVGENTLIKLMTDGILLAEIQQDRLLMQYDTLIIDEAHERSLNIDFILGYLRQLLPKRPDLKVIITSATIDSQRFSRHFHRAPIIEVSGRTYPVEVRYRPVIEDAEDIDRDQLQGILDAVDELDGEAVGDILIFMSGEREIRDTAEALSKQNLRHTEILPLYARLSASEQNRIFQAHTGRRIVLATNVAETSLTVPGIKYVIDPGTARISRYSYRTKVQRLPIEAISQASANQRKGRCGRVSDGICIRLYSEQDFLSRPAFTDPEILRTNLASVILQMTALKLGEIEHFPFVEAPDKRHIKDGIKLLEELGALKPNSQGSLQLTDIGQQLAQLPLDPRLARMVIEAQKKGVGREVMVIVSGLSIQDPRERPNERLQAADEKHRRFTHKESDFLSILALWDYIKEQQNSLSANQFRKQCKRDYLNYLRVREWQDIYTQLRQVVKQLGFSVNSLAVDYRSLHTALLSGLLSHIGQKDIDKQEFTGARNTRFTLFPSSSLFKKPPKWVMVAELVETSKLWGRIAARIEPEWIEEIASHLIRTGYYEPHWEKSAGAVMAHQKSTLFGLTIVAARKVNYGNIDPIVSRELFIRHALVEGDWQTRHKFWQANRQLLSEVAELEHKSRRRDILVEDETLFEFYDQRIDNGVVSTRHFDRWWGKISQTDPELLNFEKSMLVKSDAQGVCASDYPNVWQQGKFKLRLSYQFEPGDDADGVTVHIPLVLLNQIEERDFDWQIPGLRRELVIALIKSLPKAIRRNVVPASNYADAFLARAIPFEMPLLAALEHELQRMTGVTVSRDAWQWDQLAEHLRITFKVIDEKNNTLAENNSLAVLKKQLKDKIQQTLATVADDALEQQGLRVWSFGSLPQCYQQKRQGYTIKAFPALVDEQDSVAVRLFETEQQQQQVMKKGLRRLLLLNTPSPIKYLHEKLPNKAKLGLYFNSYGKVLDLIDDCIASALDALIIKQGGIVWHEEAFAQLQQAIRVQLNEEVVGIALQVEQILEIGHRINKRLKGRLDLKMALALNDMKSQMTELIYPGFVTASGAGRLPDLIRYLAAIERRLEKLAQDPQRDRRYLLKVEQAVQAWQQWLNTLSPSQRQLPQVQDIRWMLEELRVSYFAQQLGTPYSISEKRILQAMSALSV